MVGKGGIGIMDVLELAGREGLDEILRRGDAEGSTCGE
jgi:hypothetical protein